jgi:hypothetical protein
MYVAKQSEVFVGCCNIQGQGCFLPGRKHINSHWFVNYMACRQMNFNQMVNFYLKARFSFLISHN